MKYGDLYQHYKDVEYFFDCIALPLGDHEEVEPLGQVARYHEDTHDLELYTKDGVTFIDAEAPHVIYQSEKDYETDRVFAREVDDFFGWAQTGQWKFEKRFTLKERKR